MQPGYYITCSVTALREGDRPEITFDSFEITVDVG